MTSTKKKTKRPSGHIDVKNLGDEWVVMKRGGVRALHRGAFKDCMSFARERNPAIIDTIDRRGRIRDRVCL